MKHMKKMNEYNIGDENDPNNQKPVDSFGRTRRDVRIDNEDKERGNANQKLDNMVNDLQNVVNKIKNDINKSLTPGGEHPEFYLNQVTEVINKYK